MTQFQILVLRALFALVCAARHLAVVFKKDVEGRGFATSGNIDRLYEVEKDLAEVLAKNPPMKLQSKQPWLGPR